MKFLRNQTAVTAPWWQRLKKLAPAGARVKSGSGFSFNRRMLAPALLLLVILLAILITGLLSAYWPERTALLRWAQVGLAIGGIFTLAHLFWTLQTRLLGPVAGLRAWATRLHSGAYGARMPENMGGEFAGLVHDLNDLGDELRSLNLEMSSRVRRHTLHREVK